MGIFSKGGTIGIDIGHTSIKVVGLSGGRFVGCKEFQTGGPYLTKGGIADPAAAAAAIREALKQTAPRPTPLTGDAYAVVAESLLFRKIIEMPVLADQDELRAAVLLEAAQYLPEALATMEVDFTVLGPAAAEGRQEVMVVAATSAVVESYMQTFRLAKLSLKSLEPAPSAMARGVIPLGEKSTVMLVNVSSQSTTISLCISGRVEVTGGVNQGSSLIESEEKGGLGKLAEGIAEEIDHVLKFSNSRSLKPKEVTEIQLSGAGSLANDVPEALARETGLSVVGGRPVIPVPPFCDRRFLTAIGAALFQQAEQS